jgi:hypothetical protein
MVSYAQTQTNPYQGGVVPMTVEPLHQFEQAGLTQLAQPPAYGQGSMTMANQMLQQMMQNPQQAIANYTNPMATQYMQRAGDVTGQAINPITMQEIEGFRNPYASAMKARLNEQGERARAAIMANQGVRGARSFGDTSQGVRQGMLDQEMLSKGSDIDYNTYESSLQQLNTMRDRMMQGGSQFGNLGTQAQGISSSAMQSALGGMGQLFGAGQQLTEVGRQTAQDKLGAGNYIRTYNQGVNDMIGNDILASIQDNPNKMAQVMQLLEGFKSGTTTTSGGGANSLQQLGGLATAGGGLLDYLGNTSVSGASNLGAKAGDYLRSRM